MATKRCYKYPIVYKAKQFSIHLPVHAQFLRVAWQGEELMAWFLVDMDTPLATRTYYLYGTGHDIPCDQVWVTTFDNGPFVMHMFERRG